MAMAVTETLHPQDNRRVALIKSLATNNRFYALVRPETGIRNADTVEHIPDDLLLGIAYPCLEDGLNDFAVIRTTYETMDFFEEDDEMRKELMGIVEDARGKLVRRLTELRDRVRARSAHFLGTDLEEFKAYALDIMDRGYPRRNLDSMMKLNVFASVAEAEGHKNGSEPYYRYEFRPEFDPAELLQLPSHEFVAAMFADVLNGVLDDANYKNRYTFDRNVFQKFIALMFINYATTDPVFYGTNKADYGVSEEKDMEDTPLYRAVARELRAIEARLQREKLLAQPAALAEREAARRGEAEVLELPGTLVNEDALLGSIASLCATAKRLAANKDPDTAKFGRVILTDAARVVQELKRLGLVSPFAYDPTADNGPSGDTHCQS